MTDWEQIAHNRIRLFWLGLALGLITGVVTGLLLAAPPVWIDDLPQAGYTPTPLETTS
ncbi:hypothetical protein ACFLIN_03875 [Corynebacterium kutscheri]|uniref:hypothetical protein n=1 Tax=Corynebacterium kutscheri TaxID=35755 RepID=UPI0037BEE6CD